MLFFLIICSHLPSTSLAPYLPCLCSETAIQFSTLFLKRCGRKGPLTAVSQALCEALKKRPQEFLPHSSVLVLCLCRSSCQCQIQGLIMLSALTWKEELSQNLKFLCSKHFTSYSISKMLNLMSLC